MSRKSITKASKTDWARLEKMTDSEIDLSEIPEVTAEQLSRAPLRLGGKPAPKNKIRVSLRLDAEVLAYFKTQSRPIGKNYQAMINETLKASILSRNLETVLRRIIREELQASR